MVSGRFITTARLVMAPSPHLVIDLARLELVCFSPCDTRLDVTDRL